VFVRARRGLVHKPKLPEPRSAASPILSTRFPQAITRSIALAWRNSNARGRRFPLVSTDVSGIKSRARGFHVTTMEGGGQVFRAISGHRHVERRRTLEAKGNLGFTGGSGKLKGIKGKGTYTGLASEVDGEYQLAK
jgi:hypothetical protein